MGPVPEAYVKSLSRCEKGIQLAIDDMSIYGGGTRGQSSRILRETPLAAYAKEALRSRILSKRGENKQRVKWICVYALRWKELEYLPECFNLVRAGSPKKRDPFLHFARAQLAYVLDELVDDEELSYTCSAARDFRVGLN